MIQLQHDVLEAWKSIGMTSGQYSSQLVPSTSQNSYDTTMASLPGDNIVVSYVCTEAYHFPSYWQVGFFSHLSEMYRPSFPATNNTRIQRTDYFKYFEQPIPSTSDNDDELNVWKAATITLAVILGVVLIANGVMFFLSARGGRENKPAGGNENYQKM